MDKLNIIFNILSCLFNTNNLYIINSISDYNKLNTFNISNIMLAKLSKAFKKKILDKYNKNKFWKRTKKIIIIIETSRKNITKLLF